MQEAVARAEGELGGEPRRLHYLSIPPGAFGDIVVALGASGLADRARVVLEKPFGVDLESARELNALVHGVFPEERVFRIDHFLGREAVQNLIALRFANGMFEPVWNRDHIDHVQIDVPETLAVDDRAGFYEDTGAYRDMVVTHLFHVLGFVAMEPPTTLEARSIVEETGKVFRSVSRIDPADVIRGQYAGYREGPGVDAASQTETFIALRAGIDNWRWSGVPFFLRTGKRLGEQRRLLTIAFREPPRRMFRAARRVRGGLRARPHLVRPRRPRRDHDALPGQGARAADAPRPGPDGVHLRGLLRHPGPRALRAADVRRDARRPHAVHRRRGDREPVGGLERAGRGSAAAAPLHARLLRAAEDARADRAAALVAAGGLTPARASGSAHHDPAWPRASRWSRRTRSGAGAVAVCPLDRGVRRISRRVPHASATTGAANSTKGSPQDGRFAPEPPPHLGHARTVVPPVRRATASHVTQSSVPPGTRAEALGAKLARVLRAQAASIVAYDFYPRIVPPAAWQAALTSPQVCSGSEVGQHHRLCAYRC